MIEKKIRCNEENVDEMRKVVKSWPELHGLVKSLQAQGLFPGLRAMQITLRGDAQWVGKGLGALIPPNAPEGLKTDGEVRP